MAISAVLTEAAAMRVVRLVAGIAVGGGAGIDAAGMAGDTGQIGMETCQGEGGK